MKSKRARDAVEAEDKHVEAVDVEAPPKKRKRSDDDAKVKKSKKSAKYTKEKESRKERKNKRKDLQDLPAQEDDDETNLDPATTNAVEEDSPMANADPKPAAVDAGAANQDKAAKGDKKRDKKEKKEKKAKDQQKQHDAAADPDPDATADSDVKDSSEVKPKAKKDKDKKDKKGKKDKKKATNEAEESNDAPADPDADAANDANKSEKVDRHIVFVGNLPFTATAKTIEAHFASLSPVSVRCMSDPNDSKPCRGFAFVEFAKVWHMRTCLDKFHHSMFEDGVSSARRINVELTAGGGGKTQHRKNKINEKNRKLEENRTKRIEQEKNAKEENKANGKANEKKGNSSTQQHMEDSIHPSRRAHVPANRY